jgi:sortase A
MRAMIVNGTTATTLRRAVGHIEGTPLFASGGNVGLAAHRDTFFRGLGDIRRGDIIEIDTLQGAYEYVVDATRIVGPDDTSVLDASERPTLTLVTCYPFDYVGPAPRRFIVQAYRAAAPSDRGRLEALEFRR